MFSILSSFIRNIIASPAAKNSNTSCGPGKLTTTYTDLEEAYNLFDCVLTETRYKEIQQSMIEGLNPEYDPFIDVGTILGSSRDFDSSGLPSHYVVGWYNLNNTEKPVIKKHTHLDLIPIAKPLQDIDDRGLHLNTMFRAFFENWLELYDHKKAMKN